MINSRLAGGVLQCSSAPQCAAKIVRVLFDKQYRRTPVHSTGDELRVDDGGIIPFLLAIDS